MFSLFIFQGVMIFNDIDMRLAGCSVTSCYQNYNLTSWLMLQRYTSDARSGKLENIAWTDTPDASVIDFARPSNFLKRYELFKESKFCKLIVPCYLPLHLQNR